MKTRQTSRDALFDPHSSPLGGGFVGALLALALSGCSSDDREVASQPLSSSPATESDDGTSSPSADMPNSDQATEEGDASEVPSDEPATSTSDEGQPIADLAEPAGETDSGETDSGEPNVDEADSDSDPDMPQADAETESEPAEETEPEPGAPVPSAGCGNARTLPDGNQTITSSGMNRTFFLETPDGYDNSLPHRVVFMFHWNFGSINAIVNPPDADRNTDRPFYGMGDLTDDQTIFVVPQGLISNTGGAGWQNVNNQDVIFTDDMLAAISSDLCIDESRVFTTGFSFGAAMSYQLACVRPEQFRAAVVYNAAALSGTNPATCTTPIAFFGTHGVTDPIINYQTGVGVLNVFARNNGCTAMTPPQPPQNGHTCVSLEGCSVPTRFCNFGGGEGNPFNTGLSGHYPSAKDPGETTSWIPAEAWSFITQF